MTSKHTGRNDKSTKTGESIPRIKPSFHYETVGENEPKTTDAWGANLPDDVRTRGQAKKAGVEAVQKKVPGLMSRTTSTESKVAKTPVKEGLDRPDKGGDRPEGLRGPITEFESVSVHKFLDRPEEAGGDQNKDGLDRPEEGGDRQNVQEGKGKNPEPKPNVQEDTSTPVVQTSDPSNKEVEDILETNPSEKMEIVPPEPEVMLPTITKDTNETKDLEVPKTPTKATEAPKPKTPKTPKTQAKPDSIKPREFLKEKEPKLGNDAGLSRTEGPPEWKTIPKTGATAYIRAKGSEKQRNVSEEDYRSLRRRTELIQNAFLVHGGEDTRETIIERIKKEGRPKVNMPEVKKGKEIIRIDPITQKLMIGSESEPGSPTDSESDEEVVMLSAIEVATLTEPEVRVPMKEEHESAMRRLSAINSSGSRKRYSNRPMNEVRIDYGRDPSLPNVLDGTYGMRLLKERAHTLAPSISAQKGEGSSKWRATERELDEECQNTWTVKPTYSCRWKAPDHGRSSGDEDSDGYRRPRRNGGSGGSGDPGGPGGPRGPRRYDRAPRDDPNNSDGWDRNIKMKHPTPYNGKPDIQVYDQWMASITNYAQTMKIRERTMIGMMSAYVTGKAGDFYMRRVAGRADEWTYATVFHAIFDHCFPKHIIRQFREQWNKLVQGKREVREYTEEIERLASRFQEMTERTVVLKLWDGLNPELRELMIPMGAEPEVNDLNDIIQMAERAKTQRNERNRMRNHQHDNQ